MPTPPEARIIEVFEDNRPSPPSSAPVSPRGPRTLGVFSGSRPATPPPSPRKPGDAGDIPVCDDELCRVVRRL